MIKRRLHPARRPKKLLPPPVIIEKALSKKEVFQKVEDIRNEITATSQWIEQDPEYRWLVTIILQAGQLIGLGLAKFEKSQSV